MQLTHNWLFCERQLSQLLFQLCYFAVSNKVFKQETMEMRHQQMCASKARHSSRVQSSTSQQHSMLHSW